MKPFTPAQEKLLLALAIFGLIIPNGLFLDYSLVSPAALPAALSNPVALVFICLFQNAIHVLSRVALERVVREQAQYLPQTPERAHLYPTGR